MQTLYPLSDDQTEYQLKDRLSLCGYRAGAARSGAGRQDDLAVPRAVGAGRRGGTAVRPLRRAAAGQGLAGDGRPDRRRDGDPSAPAAADPGREGDDQGRWVPAEWTPARRAQVDHDGRWTIKRSTKRQPVPGDGQQRQVEIAVPMFGYKNHVGIDREFGFVRRYTITHAAAYDGGQLGAVLDRDNTASDVWADTAYRSAANLALQERRGLTPQFRRKKPRGRKMPAHIARGRARQCYPCPGALAGRARLCRPEMPARPRRAHRRHGPRPRQDRPGQSRF